MELVAVVRDEVIEPADGLYDIIVADFYQRGPEAREDWIAHIRGVEILVPRRPTDDEIQAAVEKQLTVFERAVNAPVPPPEDTRTRRTIRSTLIGVDLEPAR